MTLPDQILALFTGPEPITRAANDGRVRLIEDLCEYASWLAGRYS